MHRYDYIDIAKGIGILLVVWAHIMITGDTHRIIYAFHMPLFFMISGMLFQRTKYKSLYDFIKKRTKRLLLPYLAYSIATWMIWVLFRMIRDDDVVSYWMPLLQTVIAKGSGEFIVHNSALWFIPCLFATEILYYIISRKNDFCVSIICLCCTGVSFILGYYFGDGWWFLLPWNFDAVLIALTFFGLGNILVKHYTHEQIVTYATNHRVLLCVTLAFSFALLCWGAMSFGVCSMGSSSYGCSGFVFVSRAVIGSVSLLSLSIAISWVDNINSFFRRTIGYVKWLGVNSLDVLCLHIPIKGVFVLVIAALLHMGTEKVSSTLLYSLYAFMPTILTISIAIIILRWIKARI